MSHVKPFKPFNSFHRNISLPLYFRIASHSFHDFANVQVDSMVDDADKTTMKGKSILTSQYTNPVYLLQYEENSFLIEIYKGKLSRGEHEGYFLAGDYIVDVTIESDKLRIFPCITHGDDEEAMEKRWKECPKYRNDPLNLEELAKHSNVPLSVVKTALMSVSLET